MPQTSGFEKDAFSMNPILTGNTAKFQRPNLLWPLLLILTFLLFGALTLDSQSFLSPDDHGKDLYAFQEFLKGQWPCRDYWWQYGPLMLFYYSFWLKVFGIHLISIRLGVAFLYLASAFLTYRSLRLFISPALAFLASLAFLIPWIIYPYYNFNHLGAPPFILLSVFCLWKYFLNQRLRWAYGGTLALVGLAWIKINIGITSFAAFYLSLLFFLFLTRPSFSRRHLFFLPLLFTFLTAGAYLVMYSGTSLTYAGQCLNVQRKYHITGGTPRDTCIYLIDLFFVWQRYRLWWLALLLIFSLLGFLGLRRRSLAPDQRRILLGVGISLLLYELGTAVMELHFLARSTRFDYWSIPILTLFLGLSANEAKNLLAPRLKVFSGILIFLAVLISPIQSLSQTLRSRTSDRYLDFERGKIYITHLNSSTVETMKKVTRFLLENTKPGDSILTLPIAPLYCFLSGRSHAVRELYFGCVGRDAHLRDWQEERVLRELEIKKVPLVVLSNLETPAPGLGGFGKDCCQKIARYVLEHYKEVRLFEYGEKGKARAYTKIFQKI